MSATPSDSERGDDSTAEGALARALADAHVAWLAGERERAIGVLTAFVETKPDAAQAWARLGSYALEAARNDDALIWLRTAVTHGPGDAVAWTNLGTAWLRAARADEAIAAYRQAQASIRRQPPRTSISAAHCSRQATSMRAVAALETARGLAPAAPEVLNNLGNLYKEQGRVDDAFAAYEAARRAAPEFRPAFSNLLALTKLSVRHTPQEIFALHRAFAARYEREWQAGYVPPTNAPDPERGLRIGYVSPDCHTALPAFIEPVLRSHDRTRFTVFAYFNNPQPTETLERLGVVTARVMKGADDESVAQWIRDDGIDVLIDIAGHTGHNRLGVFGRKPAPVQVTWLDYLNTTGLDAIDYRLTDAVSDPPGNDALHSETLVRLAPAQWCWNPPAGEPLPTALPMLAAGHPTLGSFNNGSKLTDETLALWSRLLAAIPHARLLIVGVPDGSAQARVRAAFGAAADRVRIAARLDRDAFRQAAATIDIALDPRPFSGATTTLEMLWQGAPVVTWPGATSPSRSTASLNSALGLADWIARDEDDYIAIVSRALADPAALANLRRELPARLRASPLCDAAAFTRRLEAALLDGWRRWCARKSGSVVDPPSSDPARRRRPPLPVGEWPPMRGSRRSKRRCGRATLPVRSTRRARSSTICPNGSPPFARTCRCCSPGRADSRISSRARSRPHRRAPERRAFRWSSARSTRGNSRRSRRVIASASPAARWRSSASTTQRRWRKPTTAPRRRRRATSSCSRTTTSSSSPRISDGGSSPISTVTTASALPAPRASPGPNGVTQVSATSTATSCTCHRRTVLACC